MSLRGIDVSGWDEGIDLAHTIADFVFVKSTEGLQGTRYNPGYRAMADEAAGSGKLIGFYHYANGKDAVAEADAFYAAVSDYKGRAAVALDWEGQGNPLFGTGQDVAWCKRFLDRLTELWGATPLLYIDKGTTNAHDWSPCRDYPLWGAQYASNDPVYGYQSEPWQSSEPWGAWGKNPTIFQYTGSLHLNSAGDFGLDGNIYYGTREDWARLCGRNGSVSMTKRERVLEKVRSQLGVRYYSMHEGPRGSAVEGWGCAMLCAWCYDQVLGTAYYGSCYNFAGDALGQSPNHGGGQWQFVDDPRPGDLVIYVKPDHNGRDAEDYGHIAMLVGNDRIIGSYGVGKPGEPGYKPMLGVAETSIGYQSLGNGWRYLRNTRIDNEPAPAPTPDPTPTQPASKPKNDLRLAYRAHVQKAGWLPAVRDGQIAGTTGYAARIEAIKITPPEGVHLEVHAHVQGHTSELCYEDVHRGKSSGTGSSAHDPIIGTVGEGKRLEAVKVHVTKLPAALKDKKIWMQAHVERIGWLEPVCGGAWCGTRGKSLRLEAIKMWFE